MLILENLEQVVSAAGVLSELLGRCRGLAILATSRTVLGLAAERQYPVPPLPLPADTATISPAELESALSGALFVDRARAVKREVSATLEELRSQERFQASAGSQRCLVVAHLVGSHRRRPFQFGLGQAVERGESEPAAHTASHGVAGRLGEQNLPAVRAGLHPGAPVDRCVVNMIASAYPHLPGVQTDACS